MTERIRTICEALPEAEIFADIGCDHGYCTKYMLDRNKCKKAYISDISAKCLQKASTLLQAEIARGRCVPVVADGLEGIPEACDLVLIAGLGGEEIVKILSARPLPASFALQPMKNTEKVREFLLARGAKIARDFTFRDGKYYDLITGGGVGGDAYTALELEFGRDNLNCPNRAFLEKLRGEREKLNGYLCSCEKREARAEIAARVRRIEEVLHAVEKDI